MMYVDKFQIYIINFFNGIWDIQYKVFIGIFFEFMDQYIVLYGVVFKVSNFFILFVNFFIKFNDYCF